MTGQKSTEHYKCRCTQLRRRLSEAAGSIGRPSTVHAECLNVCLWTEGLHVRSHPCNPVFPVRSSTTRFCSLRWTRSHCIVSIIPKYIDALVQYRHQFKSSVTVQIWILHCYHKQPFPLPHYCGIGDPPRSASVTKKWKWPFVNGCGLSARHLRRNF